MMAQGSSNPWNAGQSAWGSPKKLKAPTQQTQPEQPQQPPTTFAQMQASGQARPAPPAVPAPTPPPNLPQMTANALRSPGTQTFTGGTANMIAPGTPPSGPTDPTGGSSTGNTGTSVGVNPSQAKYPTYTPNIGQPQIGGDLQTAVQNALQTGSRYNLPQVQQVRDALTGQLQQQFGAQQKALDEQMAARGIGASSIAGGYYGDLAGQQANALAGLNASLIQDQAGTSAQDIAAALGAGQGLYNSQAGQNLAGAQLGLQGTLGLGGLGQQMNIARMGDVTANRGIDVQGQVANNSLMMQVANWLAAMGYPTNSSGTTGSTAVTPNATPKGTAITPGSTGLIPGGGGSGPATAGTPTSGAQFSMSPTAIQGGQQGSAIDPSLQAQVMRRLAQGGFA